jgi:phosphoenolpyruvate-protein kinase (PTS system EI component)
MGRVRDGIPASPGIVMGRAFVLRLELPRVPHIVLAAADIEGEIERFHEARRAAQARIREIQQQTVERLGHVEAQIFEPQILMLETPSWWTAQCPTCGRIGCRRPAPSSCACWNCTRSGRAAAIP